MASPHKHDNAVADGLFADATRRLDQAAKIAEIDPEAVQRLRHPQAALLFESFKGDHYTLRPRIGH